MGIFNREYMRRSSSLSASVAGWSGVWIIISINIAVFLLWNLLVDPGFQTFMRLHFRTSLLHLQEGYVWTLLTSAFSHHDVMHIFLNMFVFWNFASFLEREWGRRRLIIFYCAAGVTASLAHCLLGFFPQLRGPALGASGAVVAIVVFFGIRHRDQRVFLFGVLPIPALVIAGVYVVIDVWGLVNQLQEGARDGGIGHGAHLGGAAFGALCYWLVHVRGVSIPGITAPGRRRRRVSSGSERTFREMTPPDRGRRRDADDERLDQLLAKVKDGGLDVLTPEEREFLLRMSQRARRDR